MLKGEKRMLSEIGSNFWINPNAEFSYDTDITPSEFGICGSDYVWLSTCRSAISLAIKIAEARKRVVHKVVFAPAFTCETVIEPFIKAGYKLVTFSVDKTLHINVDNIIKDMEMQKPVFFIFHRYFGFDTTPEINRIVSYAQSKGVSVIEDRTQCLYSTIDVSEADYIVGSIRKWCGVPDGGFLVCKEGKIVNKPIEFDRELEQAKIIAGNAKYRFLYENVGSKEVFLEQYKNAESILENQSLIYEISPFSYAMQASLDTENIRKKRQRNYITLLENLQGIKGFEIIFRNFNKGIVPLYFPVFVKNRGELQKKLRENAIYVPIIWPKPMKIGEINEIVEYIYQNMICIPIDQRYDDMDMNRIVSCIKSFYDNIYDGIS